MSKTEIRVLLTDESIEILRAIAEREVRPVASQLIYMITNWDRVSAAAQLNPVNTSTTSTPKRGKYHPRLHKGPGAPKAKDKPLLERRQAILDNLPSDAAREAQLDHWDAKDERNKLINKWFPTNPRGGCTNPGYIVAPWIEFSDNNGAQNWHVDKSKACIYIDTADRDSYDASYYFLRYDFNPTTRQWEGTRMDEFYSTFFLDALQQLDITSISVEPDLAAAEVTAAAWRTPPCSWHKYITEFLASRPDVPKTLMTGGHTNYGTNDGRWTTNYNGYKPVV